MIVWVISRGPLGIESIYRDEDAARHRFEMLQRRRRGFSLGYTLKAWTVR